MRENITQMPGILWRTR